MARFRASKPPAPIEISRYLGINEAVGETEIQLGEATTQVNFRITQNYKPQKRTGHQTYIDFGNALDIQAMWHGTLGSVETLIACNNGHVYRDKSISGTSYDSLDTTTYTNVDVVKTTALTGAEAGSTAVDDVVILYNSARVKLTEVAFADVDLVASVGKFYFDADEKINYIVTKGTYADITAARTGLGTTTAYYRIGTLTDAKTTIFYFEGKLYFLNGTEYKEYDGTTYQDVDPYIPTVAIGTPPAGGGTSYESINLLTGKKLQEFVGDGVATVFQLAETSIDADLVTCTIAGVAKTELTHFTVNRTAGTINFAAGTSPHGAPADESEVILGWTKVESGNADLVKKNKYAMINGPGNDTAIFLWGNSSAKNRRSWSGTLKANYFPVINYTLIGSNEFAITDIKPQYNRQIIFKQDRTHYSYPEWNSTAQAWDYPVYDLNEKVGNEAYNGVQIVRNNPVSLAKKSWWEWTSTSVEDERNASVISERIRDSLSVLDLTTAITFDNQREKEYWCNIGENVYIWNYGNNTMYIYDNISGTCFLDIDGQIYYGSQGTIERMEDITTDNGVAITAQLVLGFEDWGVMELIKNSREVFVSILPASQTSLNVYYRTNKINEFTAINKTIEYRLLGFDSIDFDNFSFSTNRNPQTFRRKIRAKKYTHIQFMLENKELSETCTVLSFKAQAETQGVTK